MCLRANRLDDDLSSFWAVMCLLIIGTGFGLLFDPKTQMVGKVAAAIVMAVSALFLLAYTNANIIGWFSTRYKDVDGVTHRHIGYPDVHNDVYCDKQDRLIP